MTLQVARASTRQFGRKAGLLVFEGDAPFVGDLPLGDFDRRGIDLSDMRFTFSVKNADSQSPNAAEITVWNLSEETVRRVKALEHSKVVVQVGYEANYGVIFQGDVKQFLTGRANPTDTFLTIYAADGDIGFNFGVMSAVFPAGNNRVDVIKKAAEAMGMSVASLPPDETLRTLNPNFARGKVAFGMARDLIRGQTKSMGCSWSIQNGKVQVIAQDGYLPGEAVVINKNTGMIGVPRQTDQGIYVRTLLNPRIVVGATVRLNNASITKLVQADKAEYGVPFNQWAGIQFAARIADGADGLYRVYVAEHEGDTRGAAWWTDIVCLAIAPASGKVTAQ